MAKIYKKEAPESPKPKGSKVFYVLAILCARVVKYDLDCFGIACKCTKAQKRETGNSQKRKRNGCVLLVCQNLGNGKVKGDYKGGVGQNRVIIAGYKVGSYTDLATCGGRHFSRSFVVIGDAESGEIGVFAVIRCVLVERNLLTRTYDPLVCTAHGAFSCAGSVRSVVTCVSSACVLAGYLLLRSGFLCISRQRDYDREDHENA